MSLSFLDTVADMDSRIPYLTEYLNKSEELLASLTQSRRSSRTQAIALLSATEKIQKERTCVEQELSELLSRLGGDYMEVDSVEEAPENKEARTDDHGITNRKRSLREMRGDSDVVVQLGLALSLSEEIQNMLSKLRLEGGMSVIEWFNDGMGGTAILKSLECMAIMVGKRLSTATAEISYLMRYGTESAAILESFKKEIQAEATESSIIKRRIKDVLLQADHHMLQYTVSGIHPQLHDLVFKEALAGLLQQCRSTITETESLLAVQKLTVTDDLAREKLATVVDELRNMHDQIFTVEVGIIEWRSVFNAYNRVAESKMDGFVLEIEKSPPLRFSSRWMSSYGKGQSCSTLHIATSFAPAFLRSSSIS